MNTTDKRYTGWASGVALTMTLLLVNAAAIWGQAGWALSHVVPRVVPGEWTYAGQIGIALAVAFACAIEGVGVFLALSADEADEAGLPSGGTRLASYGVGLFVSGGLNLSHWGFQAAGIAFAFLSAISPLLWGVRARIRRRRAVAPSRRLWHPIRSIALIRAMAWEGIVSEEEGMAYLRSLSLPLPLPLPTPASLEIETYLPDVAPEVEPEPVKAPARERSRADVHKAVASLQESGADTPAKVAEAARVSGISLPAVRRYASVVRTLRLDPHAEIDARKLSVRQDLVNEIRGWARRESVR